MRTDIIDDVEIIEPPIQELTKHRRSLFRTCVTGGGCIILFIALTIGGLRLAIGPGPTTLKKIPEVFPKDIPLYDRDNIEQITFIPGHYKNRGVEIASFIPKIILTPLIPDESARTPTPDARSASFFGRAWWMMASSPIEFHDTIEIEWGALGAEPDFLDAYYKSELKKKNYRIISETKGDGVRQFSFTGPRGISGSLYARTALEKKVGTDYMTLTVNLPKSEEKK